MIASLLIRKNSFNDCIIQLTFAFFFVEVPFRYF